MQAGRRILPAQKQHSPKFGAIRAAIRCSSTQTLTTPLQCRRGDGGRELDACGSRCTSPDPKIAAPEWSEVDHVHAPQATWPVEGRSACERCCPPHVPDQGNSNECCDTRAEVARIFAKATVSGPLPENEKSYLASVKVMTNEKSADDDASLGGSGRECLPPR